MRVSSLSRTTSATRTGTGTGIGGREKEGWCFAYALRAAVVWGSTSLLHPEKGIRSTPLLPPLRNLDFARFRARERFSVLGIEENKIFGTVTYLVA